MRKLIWTAGMISADHWSRLYWDMIPALINNNSIRQYQSCISWSSSVKKRCVQTVEDNRLWVSTPFLQFTIQQHIPEWLVTLTWWLKQNIYIFYLVHLFFTSELWTWAEGDDINDQRMTLLRMRSLKMMITQPHHRSGSTFNCSTWPGPHTGSWISSYHQYFPTCCHSASSKNCRKIFIMAEKKFAGSCHFSFLSQSVNI